MVSTRPPISRNWERTASRSAENCLLVCSVITIFDSDRVKSTWNAQVDEQLRVPPYYDAYMSRWAVGPCIRRTPSWLDTKARSAPELAHRPHLTTPGMSLSCASNCAG